MQQQGIPQTALLKTVNEAPPHWAEQAIQPWDEVAFQDAEPFVVEKYWSGQQSINVFDVVGTAHPDYQGLSWHTFLHAGKRMALNLRLHEENPAYYTDDAVKLPTMYYVSLDGSGWYVNGDGNHRTCIARFAFHFTGRTMLHGVNVESYRTDRYAREVVGALRELIASRGLALLAEPHRRTISREDTAGWMRERYSLAVRVRDFRHGTERLCTLTEAERLLEELRQKTTGWRAVLRRIVGD